MSKLCDINEEICGETLRNPPTGPLSAESGDINQAQVSPPPSEASSPGAYNVALTYINQSSLSLI